MKKTALFLFMLFTFALKAQETQETFYIGERSNDKTKFYIYLQTIRESEKPGYITAWFLEEYPVLQKLPNGKYYMKTKDHILINCKYNKFGIINTIYYSKNDNVVYNGEGIDEYLVKEEAMPPGSIGEDMIKVACTFYDVMSNQNEE